MSGTSSQLTSLAIARLAAALAVVVLAGASAASAHPGPWYWSERDVLGKIVGTVISVEGKRVRISSTVTCMGEGRRRFRRGVERWKHFTCIQSVLFPGGGGLAGPDALFRVHVVGPRRFRVTNARFADGAAQGVARKPGTVPASAGAGVDDLVLVIVGLLTLASASLGALVLYRSSRQHLPAPSEPRHPRATTVDG